MDGRTYLHMDSIDTRRGHTRGCTELSFCLAIHAHECGTVNGQLVCNASHIRPTNEKNKNTTAITSTSIRSNNSNGNGIGNNTRRKVQYTQHIGHNIPHPDGIFAVSRAHKMLAAHPAASSLNLENKLGYMRIKQREGKKEEKKKEQKRKNTELRDGDEQDISHLK